MSSDYSETVDGSTKQHSTPAIECIPNSSNGGVAMPVVSVVPLDVLRNVEPEEESLIVKERAKDEEEDILIVQAFCRGARDRLYYKREKRRFVVVEELVNTERSYLKALELCCDYFMNPLARFAEMGSPMAIISSDDVDMVFRAFNEIRMSSLEVMRLIEGKWSVWHANQTIGDIFLIILERGLFLPYIQFVQSYTKSIDKITQWRKNNVAFSRHLETMRMLPPLEGRSLEELFVYPNSRIPRYILLLCDILKHTKHSHPDHIHLTEATKSLQQFTSFINKSCLQAETMANIPSRIRGYRTIPPNPDRTLVYEGPLTLISNSSDKKPRYIFLFNDFIIITKENKNKRWLRVAEGGPEAMKTVTKALTTIALSDSPHIESIGSRTICGSLLLHIFSITINNEIYLLQAISDVEMRLWVCKIRQTIDRESDSLSHVSSTRSRFSLATNPTASSSSNASPPN